MVACGSIHIRSHFHGRERREGKSQLLDKYHYSVRLYVPANIPIKCK